MASVWRRWSCFCFYRLGNTIQQSLLILLGYRGDGWREDSRVRRSRKLRHGYPSGEACFVHSLWWSSPATVSPCPAGCWHRQRGKTYFFHKSVRGEKGLRLMLIWPSSLNVEGKPETSKMRRWLDQHCRDVGRFHSCLMLKELLLLWGIKINTK